jgi:hypothetical protein
VSTNLDGRRDYTFTQPDRGIPFSGARRATRRRRTIGVDTATQRITGLRRTTAIVTDGEAILITVRFALHVQVSVQKLVIWLADAHAVGHLEKPIPSGTVAA